MNTPTNSDDIRRLLAADDAEPAQATDERIRLAAREAVAAAAPAAPLAAQPRRRRWFYPASGVGAAAVMLLAVLVVQRAPDEVSVWSEDRSDHPAQAYDAPDEEAPRREPPASAVGFSMQESAADAAAGRDRLVEDRPLERAPTVGGDRPLERAPTRDGASTVGRAVAARAHAGCADQDELVAGGIALCVGADQIEVRATTPAGCADPLVLERDDGAMSLARSGEGVVILVDGVARWRVRCEQGAWQVDANP
jgi:hypothetical protein